MWLKAMASRLWCSGVVVLLWGGTCGWGKCMLGRTAVARVTAAAPGCSAQQNACVLAKLHLLYCTGITELNAAVHAMPFVLLVMCV